MRSVGGNLHVPGDTGDGLQARSAVERAFAFLRAVAQWQSIYVPAWEHRSKHRPSGHHAGEPHRPTLWGPEQVHGTSGDMQAVDERTQPSDGDAQGHGVRLALTLARGLPERNLT